jgi:hypothetical protein
VVNHKPRPAAAVDGDNLSCDVVGLLSVVIRGSGTSEVSGCDGFALALVVSLLLCTTLCTAAAAELGYTRLVVVTISNKHPQLWLYIV